MLNCSTLLMASIVNGSADDRSDATQKIEALLAEFGDRLKPAAGKSVAACYLRYSTVQQDSFESQLRSILSYAVANNMSIVPGNIFFDLGVSGAKRDRDGLQAIRQARREGQFKVFLAFASSRLARNLKTLLEVLDEEFIGNGIRCVLVDQNLDSKDVERWRLLMPLLGWLDDVQRTSQSGHIRAAHRSLLARGLFYSTPTYGYTGEPIEGFFTKRGLPIRMMVIDPDMSEVVKFIFKKVADHVSIGAIAKTLNQDHRWPRPPKSKNNRFSRDFVSRVLKNPAYIGIFVYNDEKDVSLMSPQEMRKLAESDANVFHFPKLQIVSDEEFLLARRVLQENHDRHVIPRRARNQKYDGPLQPNLLNGLLKCPGCNGNQLVVTGPHGNAYGCKTCKNLPVEKQFLYSQVSRKVATKAIVKAICDEILSVPKFVQACIAECLSQIESLGKPDESKLAALKQQRKKTKDRLDLLIRNFEGQDLDLVKDQLEEFKFELKRLDVDISAEQMLVDRPLVKPSRKELESMLNDLHEILLSAADEPNEEILDDARSLLRLLTGEKIEMFQCGQKKPKLGWLQARFSVDLGVVLFSRSGISNSCTKMVELVVDCRPEAEVNPNIARARELYDADMLETEIAVELGASRAGVFKWISQSFSMEGTAKPNGYKRRKMIEASRRVTDCRSS